MQGLLNITHLSALSTNTFYIQRVLCILCLSCNVKQVKAVKLI
jgi:hypothetical protein